MLNSGEKRRRAFVHGRDFSVPRRTDCGSVDDFQVRPAFERREAARGSVNRFQYPVRRLLA